jgi:ferredoxin-NADP reductase/predicted TIM-barrel fold metal-dependent hydrolase/nitrite reductase/ring-hydroxylating ferredoxin subunit
MTATREVTSGALSTGSWQGPVIDADVHIAVPGVEVLLPYLTDFWIEYVRESNFTAPPSLAQVYPPGAPTSCRPEWRPANGRLPGSDLATVQRELLDPLGAEAVIANCYWGIESIRHPDLSAALAAAVNDWLIEEWLDRDDRLRAAIVVPGHDPAAAAAEIDRVGDHPGFVSALLVSRSMRLYGNRLWHPLFDAIARHDLVASIHFGGQADGPPTPTGFPAYFLEEHAAETQLWLAQVTSIIAEGLLEKFPTLRIALLESGSAWLGSSLWRLDKEWKGLRRDIPWVSRPPSQTIRERIRISAQPLDAGPPEHWANVLGWLGAGELLMFSSDYPHAHEQPIEQLLAAVPDSAHASIMSGNARALPRAVAAMARHVIARVDEIPDDGRVIVDVAGRSVGVFRVRGRFFAVLNCCPHKGAELCRGSVLGHLTATAPGELQYDAQRTMLQCPWHGWEYDLQTGQSYQDASRIRPYPVDVQDGTAVLQAPAGENAAQAATVTGELATGQSGPRLVSGPFVAETFPISIDDEYVVIDLPGAAPPSTRELVVRERVTETPDVVSLVLAVPEGGPDGAALPAWAPGAQVDLVLDEGLERQYSLCGDPARRDLWRVGVLREPDGRGGSERVHALRVGDRIAVRGPRNHFALQDADRYLLIAGGIGITPLLAMASELERRGADWRLIHGGRSADSMAYGAEFARYGDRITLWPQDTHGPIDLDGLLGTPQPGTAVYCCGPEGLLDAAERRCAQWPEGSLHVERFVPRPGALAGDDEPFEVVLRRSRTTVAVAAGQSIADALSAAGIEAPTSCREGTCGTCETGVVAGGVDHRDSVLTDAERRTGSTIMICCSRATTPTLTLDL